VSHVRRGGMGGAGELSGVFEPPAGRGGVPDGGVPIRRCMSGRCPTMVIRVRVCIRRGERGEEVTLRQAKDVSNGPGRR